MQHLFLFCLSIIFASASPYCSFDSQTFYYPLSNAIQCINTIPYDPNYAKQTVDTVKATMQLYAFIDEVRNSSYGDEHSFLDIISVNVMKELDSLLLQKYDTNHQFLQEINNIFFQLKDPHTYYVKGSCYSFFAAQPLALGSRLNNDGQQEIFVEGIYSYASAEVYAGVPFESYVGSTIQLINGDDAVSVIEAQAREYGYLSKDPSCNFNFMLESAFQQRTLRVFPFPSPFQTYRLEKDGVFTDVVLPWLAISPETVTYGNNTCVVDKPQGLSSVWKDSNGNHPLADTLLPPKMRRVIKPGQAEDSALPTAGRSAFIYSVNKDVIALRISDFVPENEDAFLGTINLLLNSAKSKDIDYLIIDIRGNGGGDICLGYKVIHRLVEERRPEGRYDIIHSPLMDSLTQMSAKIESQGEQVPIFGPSWWDDSNNTVFDDLSWYTPGVQHIRGNVEGTYSEKVFHSCDLSEDYPHHLFKKIMILSDGTCGSTCAVFTTHLQEVDHVKTVSIGGIAANPKMQYFSFPGGQVMDMDSVLYFQDQLNIKGDFIVKPFPDDASLRFTLLEIYPWLNEDPTNLPLEFMFLPADMKLGLWKGNQLSQPELISLYEEVVPLFSNQQLWIE